MSLLSPRIFQDSTDFIRKINQISNLPCNTVLATLDVSSLYTNIPHEEGVNACISNYNQIWGITPSKSHLRELIMLILTNNNFIFGDGHYLQIHGTAMATQMAPSLANVFMGQFEANFLSLQPAKPLVWPMVPLH